MAEMNQAFQIETIDWSGQYGKGKLKEPMKDIGKQMVLFFVYGVSTQEAFDKLENPKPLEEEVVTSCDYEKEKTLVNLGGLRLDYHKTIGGDTIKGVKGLTKADKFARYEIQINGETGKSSIAHVFMPVGIKMTGKVVVDAFTQSMGLSGASQKVAIIRKKLQIKT